MNRPCPIYLCLFFFISSFTLNAQTTYHVDTSATCGILCDGSSWADAFVKLSDALVLANSGDSILVAKGVYYPTDDGNRDSSFIIPGGVVVFGGYKGGIGPDSNLRDLETFVAVLCGDIGVLGDSSDNSYHVVYTEDVPSSTVLDGFIIRDGFANGSAPDNDGAGWYNNTVADSSNPTLKSIQFIYNEASDDGGAMYNDGSNGPASPTYISCEFTLNRAAFGGAILNEGLSGGVSNPVFSDCVFDSNQSSTSGGAIFNWGENGEASPTFNNCSFINNKSITGSGGAIANDGAPSGISNPTFNACTFSGNTANLYGGAIINWGNNGNASPEFENCYFLENSASFGGAFMNWASPAGISSPEFLNCEFRGNSAVTSGGGLYNFGDSSISSPKFLNTVFSGNYADYGAAMFNDGTNNGVSSPVVKNCDFVSNRANIHGGAIWSTGIGGTSLPNFVNTIVWNNMDTSGIGTSSSSLVNNNANLDVSFSLIQGFNLIGDGNLDGTNASNNPGFHDMPNPASAPFTYGDFHIGFCSPVLNIGNNDSLDVDQTTDLSMNTRIINTTVDLGAYEFQSVTMDTILYVDKTKNGDGSSWENAMGELNYALSSTKNCSFIKEIWVAAGIYHPSSDLSKDSSFVIFDSIRLYGGFSGGESSKLERDWDLNQTILSGSLPGQDSYHVLKSTNVSRATVLDGFTIEDGFADGDGMNGRNGGGWLLYATSQMSNLSPTIKNCVFDHNDAQDDGGALYFESINGQIKPLIQACEFRYNDTEGGNGGAIAINSDIGSVEVTIEDCLFNNNDADDNDGGAISFSSSSDSISTFILRNCIFENGDAQDKGGAVYIRIEDCVNQISVFDSCTFIANDAEDSGGAIYFYSNESYVDISLTRCTFFENDSDYGNGGAIYFNNRGGLYCEINKSKFIGNTSDGDGGAINFDNVGVLNCEINKSKFIGNASGDDGGAINLINDADTTFSIKIIQTEICGNEGFDEGGGVRIRDNTDYPIEVTFLNSVISGNKTTSVGGGGLFAYTSNYSLSLNLINSILWNNVADLIPDSVTHNLDTSGVHLHAQHSLIGFFNPGGTNIDGTDSTNNPQFVLDFDPLQAPSENGNARLTICSPLINMGASDSLGIADTFDLDGLPRIVNSTVDLGPYEFQGSAEDSVLYVDASNDIEGDGATWNSAFPKLSTALKHLNRCDGFTEIWVADGTYYPVETAPYDSSFVIPDSLRLYGGFAGGETSKDQRSWTDYESILSGDIDMNGDTSNNSYHVVYTKNVSPATLLDGFTITQGNARAAAPHNDGGGWYNDGSNGGSSNPTLMRIKFIGNNAADDGGAMYNGGNGGEASPKYKKCLFQKNSAIFGGAILNNGISAGVSSPIFNLCTFQGNSSASSGGVFYNWGSAGNTNPNFTNCLFTGNSAGGDGGVLFFDKNSGGQSFSYFTNCSFSGNRAGNLGGAISISTNDGSPTFRLINSVIWNNLDGSGVGNQSNSLYLNGSTAFANNNLIQNFALGGTNLDGTDSLNDPLFISSLDPATAPSILGDFHVLRCSPIINGGVNDSLGLSDSVDIGIAPRIYDNTVDMGAYEYQGELNDSVIYVDANVENGGDGSSWNGAFRDLQNGLNIAKKCGIDQIWVADGTYYPTDDTIRNVSFEIPDSVHVYGGFEGTESNRSQRDWISNVSLLSGDIGVEGDSTDNSYHVVLTEYVSSATIVDGFSVMYGNANAEFGDNSYGGGWFNNGASSLSGSNPTIRNILFEQNTARRGGGMLSSGGSNGFASPYISDCTFRNNHAILYGGGLYNLASANGHSSANISNCIFEFNSAITLGGGITNFGTDGMSLDSFYNCQIMYNVSRDGGGIFNGGNANGLNKTYFNQCKISNNIAHVDAGGIYNFGTFGESSPTFEDCEISGNNARHGAGVFNQGYPSGISNPIFIRCVISGNNSSGAGGGVYNFGRSGEASPTFRNCAIVGNYAAEEGGGMINQGNAGGISNPVIVNTSISGNRAELGGGGLFNYTAGSGEALNHLTNAIIWNNQDSSGVSTMTSSIYDFDLSSIVTFSLIQEMNPAGSGNKDGTDTTNNPQFIDPHSPITAPTIAGNYRLKFGSPLINMGNNDVLPVSDSLDLDGNDRIFDGIVDLGAFEFNYTFPCGSYQTLAIDESPIFGADYKASGLISSKGTVSPMGGPVLFESKTAIELRKNFEVKLGETFEARIKDPCVD